MIELNDPLNAKAQAFESLAVQLHEVLMVLVGTRSASSARQTMFWTLLASDLSLPSSVPSFTSYLEQNWHCY